MNPWGSGSRGYTKLSEKTFSRHATSSQLYLMGRLVATPDTHTPISLQLNPEVRPIRLKARCLPFMLKPKIDEKLDGFLGQVVFKPVLNVLRKTLIVTPVKPKRDVRICVDYKCTINKALQDHAYPFPVVSHVLASLAGTKILGKLDLTQPYQQFPVDDATAEAQIIVTQRGVFWVWQLQFGVSVAPGIFQNPMNCLLKGIPGVQPFFEDVLIHLPVACRPAVVPVSRPEDEAGEVPSGGSMGQVRGVLHRR